MKEEYGELLLEGDEDHTDLLKTCAKITKDMAKLKETNERAHKLMEELEYALYIKSLWETHGTYNGKCSITPMFEWNGIRRGYFVLKRSDGSVQKYPVHAKESTMLHGDLHHGVVDLWNDELIPPRMIELFLWWNNKGHSKKIINKVRAERLKREEKSSRGTAIHPPLTQRLIFEHPSTLVEAASCEEPTDEVWPERVLRNGVTSEVGTPESNESEEA